MRNVRNPVNVPDPGSGSNPMSEELRRLAREAIKQTAFTPAFTLAAAAEMIDILMQERDEARSELCQLDADTSLGAGTPTTIAADRGWSYLYAPKEDPNAD